MKDTERILLQTFDTLKTYYEQTGQKFTCNNCKQEFDNVINLKKHTEEKHSFQCSNCPFGCVSKEDMENHSKIHEPSTSRIIFQCETCGKENYSKGELERHIAIEHKAKKVKCLFCNKQFSDIYAMNRHKEIEHKADNFNCKECKFSTQFKLELANHVLKHKSQYTYKCDICRFEDKSESKVEDHKINEHTEEMFERISRNSNYGEDVNTDHSSFQPRQEFDFRKKSFCVSWNRGGCYYGNSCKYLHEESPECRYKERCFRKENCMFFHKELYGQTEDHPSHFLGSAQFRPNRN